MNSFKKKRSLSFPRLDTILSIEKFIKENTGKFKKKKLWENLPKKTMYQTFCLTINYLIYSKKIIFDSNRIIIWIGQKEEFYNNEVKNEGA